MLNIHSKALANIKMNLSERYQQFTDLKEEDPKDSDNSDAVAIYECKWGSRRSLIKWGWGWRKLLLWRYIASATIEQDGHWWLEDPISRDFSETINDFAGEDWNRLLKGTKRFIVNKKNKIVNLKRLTKISSKRMIKRRSILKKIQLENLMINKYKQIQKRG